MNIIINFDIFAKLLSHEQDETQGQFLSWGQLDLNSEFSFSLTSCLTNTKEPSLPYYLIIAEKRTDGFMPLVLWEMQTAWSSIWTQVTVSISCDNIHYPRSTSFWVVFSFFLNLNFLYHHSITEKQHKLKIIKSCPLWESNSCLLWGYENES